jgi:hypothetical protein
MNYTSLSSFLADGQVVSLPRIVMTALIVVMTSGGGTLKALISEICFLSRELTASVAARRAGSAALRSFSASSANF